MRYLVTGATGLLGWHTAVRLRARIADATRRGTPGCGTVAYVDRAAWNDPEALDRLVASTDAILHFAGVSRATPDLLTAVNAHLTDALLAALDRTRATPTVVFANSMHRDRLTAYGASKRLTADRLAAWAAAAGGSFVDLVIPHVFGEHARPDANNVTATFIRRLTDGEPLGVDPTGEVELVHAGRVAEEAIEAARARVSRGRLLTGKRMSVPDLSDGLRALHDAIERGVWPNLADPFERDLFHALRAARGPRGWRRDLAVHADHRGFLVETLRGGGGGQTFFSVTQPGVTRGRHFHLRKVERFVVLQGEALIRLRRVLHTPIVDIRVSGSTPVAVDIPSLHTHDLTNVGDEPLLTLFWTHELYDPADPDTYPEEI